MCWSEREGTYLLKIPALRIITMRPDSRCTSDFENLRLGRHPLQFFHAQKPTLWSRTIHLARLDCMPGERVSTTSNERPFGFAYDAADTEAHLKTKTTEVCCHHGQPASTRSETIVLDMGFSGNRTFELGSGERIFVCLFPTTA